MTINLYQAYSLASAIRLDDYADDWKQPKAVLHEAIAYIILQAVQQSETEMEAIRVAAIAMCRSAVGQPEAVELPDAVSDALLELVRVLDAAKAGGR